MVACETEPGCHNRQDGRSSTLDLVPLIKICQEPRQRAEVPVTPCLAVCPHLPPVWLAGDWLLQVHGCPWCLYSLSPSCRVCGVLKGTQICV